MAFALEDLIIVANQSPPLQRTTTMKSLKLNLSTTVAFFALAATSCLFNACEKKQSPVEKIKDGLNMRENEEAKDAA